MSRELRINRATTTAQGLVPAPVTASGRFLRDDLTWAAAGGSSSPLTTKGDVHGYSTVDARIPVGTNGQVLTADSSAALGVSWQASSSAGTPGTIPDLVLWWASDDILGAAGAFITRLRERTPWIRGVAATNSSGRVLIDSAKVNGLNVLTWPAAAVSGTYTLGASFLLGTVGGTTGGTGGATYFVVARSSTGTGTQAIIGGGANALSFYLTNAGAKTVSLVKTGAAIIGSSTTVWVSATAFQANATYNCATGAYAFRQSQAAAGSGTGATGAGTGLINSFGSDSGSNLLNLASLAELIVFDRLLSPTEITNIESYLNTKWGV